ncbi:hypothetical protein T11_16059 [Trichinella zimbabwensis]|uniref:Uncharacterized protein n=1 Tax=Trichinella zimbabwensis TaxID=268475 RepID=A0A0V1HVW0_9BILA|nr:hypothetical protein T11_16059 [Trichinella zimbabwensis]
MENYVVKDFSFNLKQLISLDMTSLSLYSQFHIILNHIIKVKTVESGTVKEGVGISEKLNTNNHISLTLHQIDNMH